MHPRLDSLARGHGLLPSPPQLCTASRNAMQIESVTPVRGGFLATLLLVSKVVQPHLPLRLEVGHDTDCCTSSGMDGYQIPYNTYAHKRTLRLVQNLDT